MSGLIRSQQFDATQNYVVGTFGKAERDRIICASDFPWLAKFDGVTDDAAAINAAATWLATVGGGIVKLPVGTTIIGATIALPDYVKLQGAAQYATTIKLKNAGNVNLIEKKAGATGIGAGLLDLTINGNDANNTNGGIYWAGANAGRGPVFSFERVTVTQCRPILNPPSGEYAAILTTGSNWGVARDLDVVQNQFAVGWWHKGSDWLIDGLYLGPNGASYPSGTHSMIIQGGAGNRFVNPYFGGNGGLSQVMLWGAQRNLFVNPINDNAWQNAYLFADSGGTPASNNVFIGGQTSSSGWSVNNTFHSFSFTGLAAGNVITGMKFAGLQANKAKYAIQEQDTAGGNYVVGGITDNNYGTGFDGRRAGSGSMLNGIHGVDASEVQILVAKKRINVTGPADAAAPNVASVPLARFNNGGAVSVWVGANAYASGWLQAIQDDGTNTMKPMLLNPMGGDVQCGAGLVVDGTTGKTLAINTPAANAAIATTLGGVGPAGATAGNPQGWMRIKVGGVDRFMPFW